MAFDPPEHDPEKLPRTWIAVEYRFFERIILNHCDEKPAARSAVSTRFIARYHAGGATTASAETGHMSFMRCNFNARQKRSVSGQLDDRLRRGLRRRAVPSARRGRDDDGVLWLRLGEKGLDATFAAASD